MCHSGLLNFTNGNLIIELENQTRSHLLMNKRLCKWIVANNFRPTWDLSPGCNYIPVLMFIIRNASPIPYGSNAIACFMIFISLLATVQISQSLIKKTGFGSVLLAYVRVVRIVCIKLFQKPFSYSHRNILNICEIRFFIYVQ